ncbi:MAG TPA: type IV secretion system DNA-binding domain-containing protein [Novosphingobium sp.]
MANERTGNPRPRNPRPWSGHGDAKRNAGHFTRGSQLIGHQWSMWLRGARVPFFVWAGLFALILWARLTVVLDNYEFQMISMKALAGAWDYIGLSDMKPVNVTLKSGAVLHTYMGYVPYIADVEIAWGKLVRSLIGSFIFACLLTGPFTLWFVKWARHRGEAILADHHERGVELVESDDLRRMIERHNAARLRERAHDNCPDLSVAEAMALAWTDRKKYGLVPSYSFGTLPFPLGHEQSHAMVIGTTGSGKTTALRGLVKQAIERDDSCVIFDLTGHYMEAFYEPERDHVLNLNDARCETWSVFNDCDTQSEFVSAASALIPPEHGSDGGFWEKAARMLFVEMCVKLKAQGLGTNKALSDELLKASLKRIYARLKGTVADPLTSPDAARMAQSIRAVLNAHGEALRFLPENGSPFSIRDWIRREEKAGSILFITAQYVHLDMTRPLLTLWMNIAINTMMTLKHTRTLRTWFVFDELGALHQLPALTRGLQTARSYGGAFVLGVHSFAGLREVYGENGARNIISLTGSKLILRTSDRDTAEECSKLIGFQKVRTMDEAYSYGAHQTRDASTISPTTKEEALVIADDFTSLMNLHGYVRFSERFPSAHIKMDYVHYPSIAEGFEPAPLPSVIAPGPDDGDEDDDEPAEEGGGRDGAEAKLRDGEMRLVDLEQEGILWRPRDEGASEAEPRIEEALARLPSENERTASRSPRQDQPGNSDDARSADRPGRARTSLRDSGGLENQRRPGSDADREPARQSERPVQPGSKVVDKDERLGEPSSAAKQVRRELHMDFGDDEHRRAGGAELEAEAPDIDEGLDFEP